MMEDTTAVDILGRISPLALDEYNHVRIKRDRLDYIDIEIRQGEVLIRGSRALTVKPHVANEIAVELHDWRK